MSHRFNLPTSLAGVDSLGRTLPVAEIRRADKPRAVGLFYFLWCGEHGRHAPYDVSKIVEADPDAGYHTDSPLWGQSVPITTGVNHFMAITTATTNGSSGGI